MKSVLEVPERAGRRKKGQRNEPNSKLLDLFGMLLTAYREIRAYFRKRRILTHQDGSPEPKPRTDPRVGLYRRISAPGGGAVGLGPAKQHSRNVTCFQGDEKRGLYHAPGFWGRR